MKKIKENPWISRCVQTFDWYCTYFYLFKNCQSFNLLQLRVVIVECTRFNWENVVVQFSSCYVIHWQILDIYLEFPADQLAHARYQLSRSCSYYDAHWGLNPQGAHIDFVDSLRYHKTWQNVLNCRKWSAKPSFWQ